jgi:hypothetical protein
VPSLKSRTHTRTHKHTHTHTYSHSHTHTHIQRSLQLFIHFKEEFQIHICDVHALALLVKKTQRPLYAARELLISLTQCMRTHATHTEILICCAYVAHLTHLMYTYTRNTHTHTHTCIHIHTYTHSVVCARLCRQRRSSRTPFAWSP